MLSIDLVLSLTNPFTNYTRNRARYVLSAFVIAAAAAGSLLGLSAEKLGNTHFGFCWFVPETRDAGINKFLWAYFYTPSLAMYLFSIGVLLYAFYRLRRGMRDTYEVRQEVFRRGRNYVLGFVIYWVLAESLYFASLAGQEREAVGTLTLLFNFVFVSKGVANLVIWMTTCACLGACARAAPPGGELDVSRSEPCACACACACACICVRGRAAAAAAAA